MGYGLEWGKVERQEENIGITGFLYDSLSDGLWFGYVPAAHDDWEVLGSESFGNGLSYATVRSGNYVIIFIHRADGVLQIAVWKWAWQMPKESADGWILRG